MTSLISKSTKGVSSAQTNEKRLVINKCGSVASTLGHLCLTCGVTHAIMRRGHMTGNEVATIRRRLPYDGNFVSNHVTPMHNRTRYSTA